MNIEPLAPLAKYFKAMSHPCMTLPSPTLTSSGLDSGLAGFIFESKVSPFKRYPL